jgi:oxygen-independent coproporphyrinogen-3 oxidase
LYALGVNRLSVGVQSFDDVLLATLGRAHDSQMAQRAILAAAERFDNISIDLMCGLPGQTLAGFEADLQRALELPITHISIYPLAIERKTRLYRQIARGKLAAPDEDLQADMMERAAEVLREAGFSRYEVASYARPGYECKHNIAYWSGVSYLGVGDSAATMTQNEQRRMRVTDGQVTDDLDPAQMAAEDAMLAMRMSRGIDDARAEGWAELLPGLRGALQELADFGLVEHVAGAWRPTDKGWLCGNELYGRLLDLAP